MATRRSLSVDVTVAVAVVLFLFEVALARAPSTLHQNEVVAAVSDIPQVSESEIKPILRLPSDTIADESSHTYTDTNFPAMNVIQTDPASPDPIAVRSVPLTMLRFHDFRPINGRFALRSRLPIRRCRHHHHHHDHPFFKTSKNQAGFSYGNDMILSSNGEQRELNPVSWVRIPYQHHHHHQRDEEDGFSQYILKHSQRFGKEKFKKHLGYKHHHDDEEKERSEEKGIKEERKKRENGEKDGGGFVKRIRKFLNHF